MTAAYLLAPRVSAHAFGARYDLPLPLGLYLGGAAAAVALSFAVTAGVLRGASGALVEARLRLDGYAPVRWLMHPLCLGAARTVAVALFLLVVATGFFGSQDAFENLAPTMVWVIWWVGFAYVSALIGDLWAVVNPWSALFACGERLYARVGGGSPPRTRAYPSWLGVWPAAALFAVFAWLELVWEEAERPGRLASLIVGYSLVTWGGMLVYGRDVWVRHGEVFSVAFGLLARFAPTEVRPVHAGGGCAGVGLYLRAYAAGLLSERPVSVSMLMFVLLMLATVTLDGFLETTAWAGLLDWIASEPALRATLLTARAWGFDLLAVVETIALVAFPLLFLGVYLITAWLAARAAGGVVGAVDVARALVLSLVPIAIAYHLAHYLSYLLLAGQLIIPLASDPFGAGWDLFGSADYRMDLSVVNARFAWYTAVGAIVLGHVIAVYLAHVTALRLFGEVRAAVRSQVPVATLMVGYTAVSLWILSQPIVE